jgi:uncharacterized OB-fold protein
MLPREICPHCGNSMTPIELGDDAVLLTYTILHTVPEGFKAPINLALVELEQGPKLLCSCKNEKDLVIGKKGKIIIEDEKHYFTGN